MLIQINVSVSLFGLLSCTLDDRREPTARLAALVDDALAHSRHGFVVCGMDRADADALRLAADELMWDAPDGSRLEESYEACRDAIQECIDRADQHELDLSAAA